MGQLAVTGTPDQIRAQLGRWHDATDIVVIGLPPGIPWPAIECDPAGRRTTTARHARQRPPAQNPAPPRSTSP